MSNKTHTNSKHPQQNYIGNGTRIIVAIVTILKYILNYIFILWEITPDVKIKNGKIKNEIYEIAPSIVLVYCFGWLAWYSVDMRINIQTIVFVYVHKYDIPL